MYMKTDYCIFRFLALGVWIIVIRHHHTGISEQNRAGGASQQGHGLGTMNYYYWYEGTKKDEKIIV